MHAPCRERPRWFENKLEEQAEAVTFFLKLANALIPRIAVENPVSIMSTRFRKPDQIIQPWMFGHGETKATCLWLKGIPLLKPTNIVSGRTARVHREPPGPDRWKNRSRTYPGIAAAMADQWGAVADKPQLEAVPASRLVAATADRGPTSPAIVGLRGKRHR